jgi:hypothetical protein
MDDDDGDEKDSFYFPDMIVEKDDAGDESVPLEQVRSRSGGEK